MSQLEEPVVTKNQSVKTVRSKPSFIEVRKGREISTGGWRDELAINLLRRSAREKFIEVGELARVFYGRDTIAGQKRVRAHLPAVTIALAKNHGDVLITETEKPHNRVSAVKIFDPQVPSDVAAAKIKVERMRDRKQLSAKNFAIIWATLQEYVNGEIEAA